MAVEAQHWRFTVRQYHQMAEAGILGEDDRVELIDGQVVQMSAVGKLHVACVNRLSALLHEQLPRGTAIVSVQNPVQFEEHYELEPDVVVLRFRSDYYAADLATPADVLLIAEVADSSLAYDRATKLPLYARAGIAESWLVDVPGAAVERHTEPADGRYRLLTRAERGMELPSTVVPGLRLQVNDVLG